MSVEEALEELMPKGRAMFLAWDQGMEHGPRGFDPKIGNENPEHILGVAYAGRFTGVVFLPGDAERYYAEWQKWVKTPLILKVNSKSELYQGDDPYSSLLFERAEDAVDFATNVGATALGYTIYLGSKFEYRMTREFSSLVRAGHARGFPVIAWVYPRSKGWQGLVETVESGFDYYGFRKDNLPDEGREKIIEISAKKLLPSFSPSLIRAVSEAVARKCSIEETPTIVAYAASAAARLGADIAKIKYSGDVESFRWAVRCAGKAKVVMSGGPKSGNFLDQVRGVMQAGAAGVAVGRNVWQSRQPLEVASALREIIFGEKAK